MSLATLPPPGKAEMLAEIDRELAMRAQVYPSMVFNRKLKQHEADRRCEILRAIRAVIEERP